MRTWSLFVVGMAGSWAVGCGGAPPPAPEPVPVVSVTPEKPAKAPEDEQPSGDAKPAASEPVNDQPEPVFRPKMSVREAVEAVPADLPRLNIEQEALAAPLIDVNLYEPCSLTRAQHFSADVAIWNGRAVGIDVTTTPTNEKVAECVRTQIESVIWRDKARSLNTVNFRL